MFSFFKKKKIKFDPKKPLIWWVDGLSHRVCGLVDGPELGFDKMPWPDCDTVYLAVDKRYVDSLVEVAKALEYASRPFANSHTLKGSRLEISRHNCMEILSSLEERCLR